MSSPRSESEAPGSASPLLSIKGIGPARVRALGRLGILSAEDALYHIPRSYQDRRHLRSIQDLEEGRKAAVRGEVVSSRVIVSSRGGRRLFEVVVSDGTGRLRARWYHFRGLAGQPLFRPGRHLLLYGTVRMAGALPELVHPEVEGDGESGGAPGFGVLLPVYASSEGLSQKVLRRLIGAIVASALPTLKEVLPAGVRRRQNLPGRREAFQSLHQPGKEAPLEDLNAWSTAWHRRLVFEELLVLQLGLARIRARIRSASKSIRFERKEGLVRQLKGALPFRLTPAQEKAYGEIAEDMVSGRSMRRLLQGDVGSGKTLVATLACLLAAGNGAQSALMAPTEILAEQHYLGLKAMVEPLGLNTALLSSGRPLRERRRVTEDLRKGDVKLAVGTHSLIQQHIRFARLGLVIIDEQHRFGVRQRSALWEKGNRPDQLVMTATPIPRTMALTLYGDYDCSVLDMLPPGRLPVETVLVTEKDRRRLYEHVEGELREGNRVFVVLPLIEDSGTSLLKTVRETVRQLGREVFPGFSVGFLHGRMSLEERAQSMEKFRSGECSLLVATTVVEVGVDVPEATVMIVEHAERFGLAQLHQLRGRIGRGTRSSRCFLMAGSEVSDEARRRLATMVKTGDGFRIAEQDLVLRGPGEFFGIRQSGLPRLRVADLVRDREILKQARDEAFSIIDADRELEAPENRSLRRLVDARWSEAAKSS